MKSISKDVTNLSRWQILFSAGVKIIRGLILRPWLKHSQGILFVGKHVQIFNRQFISVGSKVKFEDYSEIQGLSRFGLHFGSSCTIGRGVQIRPSSYYGVGHIGFGFEMGNNSSIGPGGFIGCAGKVILGNNVMIGPNVTIIAENHNFKRSDESIKEQGVHQQGIIIEDDVWVGANVTILDGVTIGHGTVIGAGTIVTKKVPPNSVLIDQLTPKIKSRIDQQSRFQ
ncbi:acyltransferase [Lacticaseibacillus rhamnosus]|uniref:acyltransferase n=1 Tax=Lacticaseibacillus rhamnosus TaxID=47715 RepID=UPI000532D425|nr:acyltransferase [Lacticaseibacillus rhamnosus]